MFVIGNLLNAIAVILHYIIQFLMIVILINAILSWLRPDPSNPIVVMLDRISDFVCAPIRRMFPTVFGGLDLAPLFAMFGLWFIDLFLVATLRDVAMRLG